MQKCVVCGTEEMQNFTRFNKSKCKMCLNEYSKKYYIKNKSYIQGKKKSKEYKCDKDKLEKRRKAERLKIYGITPAQYDELYIKQHGKCAICGKHQDRLFVDHCHKTNKVRELLCRTCNTALGMASDNPNLLKKMADYIERHLTKRAPDV
jgi:Fe-S-cluster containining protein